MNKFQAFGLYSRSVLTDALIDKQSKKFIAFCNLRWPNFLSEKRKSEVLVELYPVDQTVLAFAYFSNIIAEKFCSKIISFSLSNHNKHLFYWRCRRLLKIYKSFNATFHINTKVSKRMSSNERDILTDILQGIKSKADVLDISINGDLVGREIYEAYLNELRKSTIEIHSPEFKTFLVKCIKTYLFWNNYFNHHEVKAVVMSHAIYRYGIIKTIANRKGIPVYLPTVRSLYCLINPNDWGLPCFHLYPALFKSLPKEIRDNGIAWAKERLQCRLSGEVGIDMSYSTKSAFVKNISAKNVLRKSVKIKVLIATHCFFDNPHCYGINLFPDFHEWISYLGEMSKITDYDWYLKTHPDVLPGNDEVLLELLSKYKNITRIPSETSHLQLVEEGITFILTVYGSVGHELPLLGQTVINAGDKNPHIGYEFCIHAKTIEEYHAYLLNLDKIKHSVNKQKIYEFYFMHYKFSGHIQNFFFNSFDNFASSINPGDQNSPKVYEYFINQIDIKSDAQLTCKILNFIEGGSYKLYNEAYDFSAPRKISIRK